MKKEREKSPSDNLIFDQNVDLEYKNQRKIQFFKYTDNKTLRAEITITKTNKGIIEATIVISKSTYKLTTNDTKHTDEDLTSIFTIGRGGSYFLPDKAALELCARKTFLDNISETTWNWKNCRVASPSNPFSGWGINTATSGLGVVSCLTGTALVLLASSAFSTAGVSIAIAGLALIAISMIDQQGFFCIDGNFSLFSQKIANKLNNLVGDELLPIAIPST